MHSTDLADVEGKYLTGVIFAFKFYHVKLRLNYRRNDDYIYECHVKARNQLKSSEDLVFI